MPTDPQLDDVRPDPEALLAQARREQGGGLRVFLGAAPGVGKTYAMLQAAREALSSGRDVVIGVVESHGRADTEALSEGLERIAPMTLSYRSRVFKEFDLDAALARKPQVLLMDELAHRNIPGTRHPRRFQDIRELLDAGIEVWTTLNIQHLESLNDTVARITGVQMRETVPDDLLEQARDIELIDLSPSELLKRLEQGKVYVPEQARAAMEGFFSSSNLAALRELAFNIAVDRIDADIRRDLKTSGGLKTLPVRQRLLIGIDADTEALRLIRAGRRLAQAQRAPWIVAHVQTAKPSNVAAEQTALDQALTLARSLGAETRVLRGSKVDAELLQLARAENVTTILLGQGRLQHESSILGFGKVHRLMRQNRHFDLMLIARDEAEVAGRPDADRKRPAVERGSAKDHGLAVLTTVLATVLVLGVEALVPLQIANLSLVFLIGVLLVAARTSLWPALVTAGLSFLSYNFFFTEPRLTFVMQDGGEIVTVLLFLLMAIIGAKIAVRLQGQLTMLRQTNEQTRSLLSFAERLAQATDLGSVQREAVRGVERQMGLPAAMLAYDDQRRLVLKSGSPEALDGETAQTAAEWCLSRGESSGFQTDTLPRSPWRYQPVLGDDQVLATLAVRCGGSGVRFGSAQLLQLDAMIQLISLNLKRTELTSRLNEARMSEETERLRSAILASLSHDLRTPLASMIGSGSTLRDYGDSMNPSDRVELLETIITEGERLNRYIGNLFDMTRLGHGTLQVARDWIGVNDIVAAAVQRTSRLFEGVQLRRSIPDDLPLLYVHPALIEQALINVLENAARFSSPGQVVTIAASVSDQQLALEVTDQGPGIPDEELERIFNLFFSGEGGDTRRGGSGLGLAICQGMIGAHGGTVQAEKGPGGVGTTLRFVLPLIEPPPESLDPDA